jgi:hypothetical protein
LLAGVPAQTIIKQNQQNHYREYMLQQGLPNLRAAEEEMLVCLLSLHTDQ